MADILELGPTEVLASDGVVTIRTALRYQHDKLPPTSIALEVDERWSAMVDPGPAALLPVSLVLAARLGDDLRVLGPIDPAYRRSCSAAIALQSRWFGWRCPELIADERSPEPRVPAPGRGLFFTCGIDSWGSYLALRDGPSSEHPTHLVFVDGDVHLADDVRARTVAANQEVADLLGLPLVVVRSDLRAAYDPHTRWDHETHGGVLAGIGHLLARGLGRVTIAATNAWPDAVPFGSHPALDPLWSTPDLEVVHHLPEERRWQRGVRVAADPVARRHLDVCWEAGQAGNCGRCQKCLVTMTSLHLSGHTGWEGCFDLPWDPTRIGSIGHSNPTPTLMCIEHCDDVGIEADPIRQRWERVSPSPGFDWLYRSLPSGCRIPVRTPDGTAPDDALTLRIGRLLSALGHRVDHLGTNSRASDDVALVVDAEGDALWCTDRSGHRRAVDQPADLVPLLAEIGIAPAPDAAFDPDGQRWPDAAWERLRRVDPTALDPPT
jgi:hypothetical protein